MSRNYPRPNLRLVSSVHDADCPCCRPTPGPADADAAAASANAIARACLAGLAIGLALAQAIDWYVGGPGVLAMFGAWS